MIETEEDRTMSNIVVPQEAGKQLAPLGGETLINVISRVASDPACDVDKFERLIAIHERMQSASAKAEYNAAMSACQAEIRPAYTDKRNKQTDSGYASQRSIDDAIRAAYCAHGFAVTYSTEHGKSEGCVDVVANVLHSGGHSEVHRIEVPNDGKGAKGGDVMTRTHAQVAAVTYGRNCLARCIFNVPVSDQHDDDGNSAGQSSARVETLTDAQQATILDLLEAAGKDKGKLLAWLRKGKTPHSLNSIADIPAAWYERIVREIGAPK